jgi:predicted membrane metal-binding protein
MTSSLMLWWSLFLSRIPEYRNGIQDQLLPLLGFMPGTLSLAVFFGNDSYFSSELMHILKITGTLHLFVISGSNLTLLWVVLHKAFSFFPVAKA